jgi:hypothetical protein
VPGELRELAAVARPERRLLILRAAREAYPPGLDVTRMSAGLGDATARHELIRWLARSGSQMGWADGQKAAATMHRIGWPRPCADATARTGDE